MATSGSFNTTGYTASDGSIYLNFSWSQTSQSVADNTTTIKWELKGAGTSGQWFQTGAIKVVIEGITVYAPSGTIQLESGALVASGTRTLTHNADGSRSFSASVSAGIYYYTSSNATGSGSWALETIPRASQPSLVTWPDSTQNVGDFGETFSIHMNRKSSAFTHTVRYAYGSRTGTIATGVTTGTTWAVPLSFMADIPNATSASGLIYVDTYNGSTFVGTRYTGFTVTVPADVRPSCTIALTEPTNMAQYYGSPVKGLSTIRVAVTTRTAYSSPIASCTINANGSTYAGTSATTDVLRVAGYQTVTVTVKDQRGRTGSAEYEFEALDYTAPQVTSLAVHRCDADGTENDQGEYIQAVFSAAISSMSSNNTASYVLRYKESTATTWTEVPFSALANVYTVTDQEYIFPADESSSYDVEVTATDRHRSATRATSASTAFSLMDWHPSGTGIAFGKVAQKENTMEIGLDVEFLGAVKGAIFDAVYPVGSIYLAYNHTDPATLFGGTWVRITNRFLWATTAGGTIGLTSGEQTVTLTEAQIPAHDHGGTYTNAGTARTHAWLASGGSAMGYDTVTAGGGEAHNNMPPYIQVSIWRRTA